MEILSPQAYEILREPWDDDARRTYQELRFLQLDNFVQSGVLEQIVLELMPRVREYATRTVKPHEIETNYLGPGRRFDRIDFGPHAGRRHDSRQEEAIRRAFDETGLTTFIDGLLRAAKPFVEWVTARRLEFDRVFLLAYREADFIGPHGDTQTSERIMMQLPVALNCRTAMRVLKDGWMEPFYDDPGTLRIMGPGIWHDVLPVLRLTPDRDPERVLITARLPYAKQGD